MGLAMTYLRLPQTVEGESDPAKVARRVFGGPGWRHRQPAGQVLDIGEAWQALQFLITGDPWDGRPPASDVVCGGRLLTEDGAAELGMDVIYLGPDRVKPAADHLASTPFTAIAERCDPERMAELDVQGAAVWVPRPREDLRDRVLRPAYEQLTRFFVTAAGQGQAVYKAMG